MVHLVEFTLQPELLSALGGLVPGNRNALSPYGTAATPPLTPGQLAALRQGGVVDGSGQPLPTTLPTLRSLLAPSTYLQLRLQVSGLFHEQLVYHVPDGPRQILLTTTGNQVTVSDPLAVEGFLDGLRHYLGSSVLRGLDFQATLDWDGACALAALLDLHRRARLRSLADGLAQEAAFDLAAISGASAAEESTQWLAGIMRMIDPTTSLTSLPEAMGRLVEAGHATFDGQRYRLSGQAALLGDRFLLVHTALLWGAGRLAPDGSIVHIDQLCLQSGAYDLLTIETTGQGVAFDSASPAELLEQLRYFLTTPEALPLPRPQVEAAASLPRVEASASCPKCGAPTSPGGKFCPSCGASLATSVVQRCPSCGTEAVPGERFCGSCGAKLP